MSDTYRLLIASPNISEQDRERVLFLTKKLDEFKAFQTVHEKRIMFNAISYILANIRSAYINGEFIVLQANTTLAEALSYIFDELMEEFKKRLENPLKSCVPLPGKFGKPAACPTKNMGTLETCIADTQAFQKEAKRARRALYERPDLETVKAFIEKTIAFLYAVESSFACRSFERLDTFAKNKGKRITGHMALFKIVASAYLGQDLEVPVFKGNNSNTISNASSVSFNGDVYETY